MTTPITSGFFFGACCVVVVVCNCFGATEKGLWGFTLTPAADLNQKWLAFDFFSRARQVPLAYTIARLRLKSSLLHTLLWLIGVHNISFSTILFTCCCC